MDWNLGHFLNSWTQMSENKFSCCLRKPLAHPSPNFPDFKGCFSLLNSADSSAKLCRTEMVIKNYIILAFNKVFQFDFVFIRKYSCVASKFLAPIFFNHGKLWRSLRYNNDVCLLPPGHIVLFNTVHSYNTKLSWLHETCVVFRKYLWNISLLKEKLYNYLYTDKYITLRLHFKGQS